MSQPAGIALPEPPAEEPVEPAALTNEQREVFRLRFENRRLHTAIKDGFEAVFDGVLACNGHERQTAMLASRYLLHFAQVGLLSTNRFVRFYSKLIVRFLCEDGKTRGHSWVRSGFFHPAIAKRSYAAALSWGSKAWPLAS